MNIKEVIYKSHTVQDLYCTICKTFLAGNGSEVFPWKCKCGEYKFDFADGWQHPTVARGENK